MGTENLPLLIPFSRYLVSSRRDFIAKEGVPDPLSNAGEVLVRPPSVVLLPSL